ncbi:RsmB/NOP family class I SAM-dependent RNA methyltransferase [Marisediminicola senii]|uniref:RsmB/NOP family class I SAM-dependent RNA methyltransferase n=1 Tax=Marisediminicola senii TaxID=2711233 RepID=UPI001F226365|nr:transcription antitermination factor NusB [Marisediminicola senii]
MEAVRESDAYANLLLPVRLERAGLNGADAGLATELTYGTLRMQGYYDQVIAIAAGRDTSKIDAPILDVLRIACHQLLSMRTAQHAAVDEAVSLAREVGSRSATGFVNGVLRTITRTDPADWHDRVMSTPRSDDERLASEYSHPVWIVRAFRRSLAAEGREVELEDLLAADNVAPRVSLVALPGLSTADDLPRSRSAEYSPIGVVSEGGDPGRWPVVRTGRARVQDEGSQLAALAVSRARPATPGEAWLDMCAGPGGKAALLAAEASIAGATLVANEVVPARAELVRSSLSALPDAPEVTVLDGTKIGEAMPERFDRILVDAPCTGLGALRRRPEARWRKQPSDVASLQVLQAALLASAVAALKPGGIVAYVTCSPHLAESRLIVDQLIGRSDGEVSRLDTAAVLQQVTVAPLDLGTTSGHVQLWPHRHGTDAMFICLLQKAGQQSDQPGHAGRAG